MVGISPVSLEPKPESLLVSCFYSIPGKFFAA